MNSTKLDIRDIEISETYFTIQDPNRGGRCVMAGMFIAAWRDKTLAEQEAKRLGTGFKVHKTFKQ